MNFKIAYGCDVSIYSIVSLYSIKACTLCELRQIIADMRVSAVVKSEVVIEPGRGIVSVTQ